MIHTPGLNTSISPFCRHKGKQHSSYTKITSSLQNIPYIFYNSALSLQIVYLITLHLRLRIFAAQHFLGSTIRLRIPIQLRNLCCTVILQKFLGTFITYNFPQSSCNPAIFYVLLYNFIQLYINLRIGLVPTTLLLCITVLIHGSIYSLTMDIYIYIYIYI